MISVMETSPYTRFWHTGQIDIPVEALIAWARAQRLLPLIGWRAEQEGWSLPKPLFEAAQVARYRLAACQTLADRQLRSLAALAQETSLEVAVVKGPVVAEAYPSSNLRIHQDLDLLVARSDIKDLIALLKQAGYSFVMDGMRGWHLPPMLPPDAGFELDVHAALARDQHGKGMFTWQDWKHSLQSWPSYRALRYPSSVEHVLYLIHHLVIHHHFEMGVLPLLDLLYMTEDWPFSAWQNLLDSAERMGMRRDVGLCLHLMTWWLGDERFEKLQNLFPEPPSSVLSISQGLLLGVLQTANVKIERDVASGSVGAWLRHGWRVLFGDPLSMYGMTWLDRLRFYVHRPLHVLHKYVSWAADNEDRKRNSPAAHKAQRDLMTWLRGGQ